MKDKMTPRGVSEKYKPNHTKTNRTKEFHLIHYLGGKFPDEVENNRIKTFLILAGLKDCVAKIIY